MELSQVRYVLSAARLLNFTKAAAENRISQPALTRSIKHLEDELGHEIFERDSKKIKLSKFGEMLLPHLLHMVEEAEATKLLANQIRLLKSAPLRVGLLSTIGPLRLSRFLSQLHVQQQAIEIEVSESSLDELYSQLNNGKIDAAILNGSLYEDKSVDREHLYQERYVVVIPNDHALASKNSIRIKDLNGEAYVDRLACEFRETVLALCNDRKIELYARFRSEREDWVQSMVLARIGFAFMPECSVSLPGIIQRPLVDPKVSRKIDLVWKKTKFHDLRLQAFVHAARQFDWPG